MGTPEGLHEDTVGSRGFVLVWVTWIEYLVRGSRFIVGGFRGVCSVPGWLIPF